MPEISLVSALPVVTYTDSKIWIHDIDNFIVLLKFIWYVLFSC